MELKIELDMNKIDYNAINVEVLKQLKESNILHDYHIENKVDKTLSILIRDTVRDYINRRYGENELTSTW